MAHFLNAAFDSGTASVTRCGVPPACRPVPAAHGCSFKSSCCITAQPAAWVTAPAAQRSHAVNNAPIRQHAANTIEAAPTAKRTRSFIVSASFPFRPQRKPRTARLICLRGSPSLFKPNACPRCMAGGYYGFSPPCPAGFCSCFDAPAPACRQWRICTLVPGSAPLLSLCPAGGLYRRTML